MDFEGTIIGWLEGSTDCVLMYKDISAKNRSILMWVLHCCGWVYRPIGLWCRGGKCRREDLGSSQLDGKFFWVVQGGPVHYLCYATA